MVSRGTATFRVNADVRGAVAQLGRLQDRARDVVRDLNRASGGSLGLGARAAGGVARGGRAVGGTVAAGFGLQAGFAVFEQLIERLFELFEGTEILETFQEAFGELFTAIAPVVGVLLQALTPVIKAITPALVALAEAFSPLIELLGGGLLFAVQALTPIIVFLAGILEFLAVRIRDFVIGIIRRVIELLNRIPGVNIDSDELPTSRRDRGEGDDPFERAAGQLAEAERQRAMAETERTRQMNNNRASTPGFNNQRLGDTIQTQVIIDGEVLARSNIRSGQVAREGGF